VCGSAITRSVSEALQLELREWLSPDRLLSEDLEA